MAGDGDGCDGGLDAVGAAVWWQGGGEGPEILAVVIPSLASILWRPTPEVVQVVNQNTTMYGSQKRKHLYCRPFLLTSHKTCSMVKHLKIYLGL